MHVLYTTDGTMYVLSTYSQDTWTQVFSSDGLMPGVSSASLAINGEGNPCAALQDYDTYNAVVVCVVGGTAQRLASTGLPAESWNVRLACNPISKQLYMAFFDQQGKISLMTYNGTSWEYVGASGFASGSNKLHLAFSGNGTPFIAYEVFDPTEEQSYWNVMRFASPGSAFSDSSPA